MFRVKTLAISLAVITCAVPAIAACSASGKGTANGSGTYTITWGGVAPDNDPLHLEAVDFAKFVESESKGRIHVNVVDNSALGTGDSLVSQVKSDTIQATSLVPAYFTSYAPSMNVFSLPFLFPNEQAALASLRGSAGASVAAELQAKSGMTALAWGSKGFTQFMTSAPAQTLAQLNGMKLRTLPSPIGVQTLSALGADAVSLDSTEVLTALETGTISGDVDSISSVIALKTYTAGKYLEMINLYFNPVLIAINTNFLNGLPADLQKIVRQAATQAADAEVKANDSGQSAALSTIKTSGVQVSTPTSSAIKQFENAEQGVYSSFEKTYGQALVNKFR